VVFRGSDVVAAIVTCGGLCPGLNDVIEELVKVLYCMLFFCTLSVCLCVCVFGVCVRVGGDGVVLLCSSVLF
jgi:hypothetical protein